MTARRAMWRRRLISLTLCLLLGAVTTVGVAWGIAWLSAGRRLSTLDMRHHLSIAWDGNTSGRITVLRGDGLAYGAFIFSNYEGGRLRGPSLGGDGAPPWALLAAERTLEAEFTPEVRELPLTRAVLTRYPWVRTPSSGYWLAESRAYGWPWLSLCRWEYEAFSVNRERVFAADVQFGERRLPYGPVGRGFLLDTLFYAVPWWVLLVAPGAVKRWQRRRRGACVACGYDVRGLAAGGPCPECGRGKQGAAGA